jgi:hypothetical protein
MAARLLRRRRRHTVVTEPQQRRFVATDKRPPPPVPPRPPRCQQQQQRQQQQQPPPPPPPPLPSDQISLLGGDGSPTWNPMWFFIATAIVGFGFAPFFFSYMSRDARRQLWETEQAAAAAAAPAPGPKLSLADVRVATMSHVLQHAVRKACHVLCEDEGGIRQVTIGMLRRAILGAGATLQFQAPAPAPAPAPAQRAAEADLAALECLLADVLAAEDAGGSKEDLPPHDDAVRAALTAALLWAEQVAAAGGVRGARQLPPPVHDDRNGSSAGTATLDPAWQGPGGTKPSGANLQASVWSDKAEVEGDWTETHSLVLLCLVVRGCGGSDSEALNGIVAPLQFEGVCAFDTTEAVQQALELTPTALSTAELGEQSEQNDDVLQSPSSGMTPVTREVEAVVKQEQERKRMLRERRIFGSLELIASGGMAGVGMSPQTMRPVGSSPTAGSAAVAAEEEQQASATGHRTGYEDAEDGNTIAGDAARMDEGAAGAGSTEERAAREPAQHTRKKTLGQTLEYANPFA